jgi:ubiquinone/menaquinone biosynthesis C-methylase UbiE
MAPAGEAETRTQLQNARWWSERPMTYEGFEGDLAIPVEPGSAEWFAEIDRRLFRSAFALDEPAGRPFGRILAPGTVAGADVLEIGCGMGTHTQLLAEAGARLTAVDLTAPAVEMTRRRCALHGLAADVRQADAESLPFEDASFDLVWAWGVLHHSRSFERCLAEATRVLRPGGRLFLMVYHRRSLIYHVHNVLIRGILMGGRLRRSFAEIYSAHMDGAYARMFTRQEMSGLLSRDYARARIGVTGQKEELLPIPASGLKQRLLDRLPDAVAARLLSRWGFFLVVEAVRR